MGIFLKEEEFCQFLDQKYPEYQFDLGNSFISINIVSLKPVMSCIYLDKHTFVAAKYNQHFETFTDTLLLGSKDIRKIELNKKGMSRILQVQTNQVLDDHEYMTFKLTLSHFTGVGWHKKNLKKLIAHNLNI